MNPTRWAQVKTIFQAAIELPASQRPAYLASQCGEDHDLRRAVESLLANSDSTSGANPAWDLLPGPDRQILAPGTQLGPYQITGTLGEGGMGRVYSASDNRLGRSVAIKVAEEQFSDRFRQEARAVAALNHPNICTLFDVGPNYLVMELIDGDTLAERLKKGPLPVAETTAIARQIADALDAAHEQGIIHRDLKPANIKIRPNGAVKVIDFGLAKSQVEAASAANQTGTSLTLPGTVMGSTSYMSPEQAEGKPVDRRTDIWAFGVVLTEMLTGRRPFQGDTPSATMAAIMKDPPALEGLPAGTPAAVRRLIVQCLEKDPALRLPHLGKAVAALSIESPPEPPVATRSRYRWIAATLAAAGAVGLGSIALLVLAPGSITRPAPPSSPPAFRPILTSPASETHPALSPDGQTVAYVWTGDEGDNADIYVKPVDGGNPQRLTTAPEAESWPRWSPDGKYLAFARAKGTSLELIVVPAAGGVERKVAAKMLGSISAMAWHPDGKHLTFPSRDSASSPAHLKSVDLETGAESVLTHPPAGIVGDSHPAYFPDGRLVFWRASTISAGAVELLNPMNKQQRSYSVPGQVVTIVPDPAANQLILSFWPFLGVDRIRRLNLGDGSVHVIQQMPANVLFPAVSRDGKRMVLQQMTRDTNIWRLPVDGARRTGAPALFLASSFEDYDPRFSPTGDQILVTSNRSARSRPWITDSQGGRNARQLEINGAYHGSPRWSPDGRRIAFDIQVNGFGQVSVVSSLGGDPQQLTFDNFENGVPSWSHDGKWIYYCSTRTGRQEIWRMSAAGGTSEQITTQGGFESQESRDGRFLYFSRSRAEPAIVRRSRDGAEETLLTDLSGRAWVLAENGLYFMNRARDSIQYFDFATKKATKILALDKTVRTLHRLMDLSPDGRALLWSQVDASSSDILLVENFR